MSLPDHLLDDDEPDYHECAGCGQLTKFRLCVGCLIDLSDERADEKLQDEKEGR